MLTARQEIARERRRQIQVRKALEAGLGTAEWPGRSAAAFYLACADYLTWSLDRLYQQDGIIHDLLRERIPAAETEAHEHLSTVSDRLNHSRAAVESFRRAAATLRTTGEPGIAAFKAGTREFTDSFRTLLRAQKNPLFQYTDRLFTDADWVRIAGVTSQSLVDEQRLFTAVQRAAPPGADPEQFTAEHRPD